MTRLSAFVIGSSALLCSQMAAAGQLVRTIPVGREPAFSVSAPDGTRIYVGNVASADISIIDTQSDSVVATIPLTHNPGSLDAIHLSIAPDGAWLYAVDENVADTGTVNLISTASNSVVATIPAGWRPTDIVVRPDGAEVFVVNHDSASVTVIAVADQQAMTVPIEGYNPIHVAFSPDSRRAYVTRDGSGYPGGLTILDTSTRAVVGTIEDAGADSHPFVSPDGSKLYITYYDPNEDGRVVLRVVSTDTINDLYQVTAEFTGPAGCAWLALSPDARKGYLVSSVSSTAEVIDTATDTVAGALQLPFPAANPVWDQATGRVFVPHIHDNIVSVIDPASDTIVETYQTGNEPWSVTRAAGKTYVTNRRDGTVSVIVEQQNHAPRADSQSVSTPLNASIAIVLTATDADTDPLTYAVVTGPEHGTLTGAPPNVSYFPATNYGGSDNFTFKATDGTDDSNVATISITMPPGTSTTVTSSLSLSTFGQAITLTATVTGGDGAPDGSVQFFDGGNLLGTSTLTGAKTSLTTTAVSAGTRSITAVYEPTDACAASTSPALTQTVNKATGTTSLAVSVLTPQYSDVETFRASFMPSFAGGPAPAKVGFKVGTQYMGEATPAIVDGVYQYLWTGQLLDPPGSTTRQMKPDFRVVTATFVDPNFTVTNPIKAITIQKEDARAAYTGPTSVSFRGSATGTVSLSVMVKDISAVIGDAARDANPGDIRNALVYFIDRSTNTIIGMAYPTLSGSDPTVGIANYDWSVNLGTANAKTYMIGFMVGYYYNRNNMADNAVIVISKP